MGWTSGFLGITETSSADAFEMTYRLFSYSTYYIDWLSV